MAIFKTIDATVDFQHVPHLLWAGLGGIENLDAAVFPGEVWSHTPRTLTQSAAQVAAIVSGDEITVVNSVVINISLTGLGSLAGKTQIWFCIKDSSSLPDEDSYLQIAFSGGLLVLMGSSSVTSTDGSLTIDDEAAGDISIQLKPASAKLLQARSGLYWDVKLKTTADDVRVLTSGSMNVQQAVTHAV